MPDIDVYANAITLTWDADATAETYHIYDEDGNIYVVDGNEANSGLWVTNPNELSFFQFYAGGCIHGLLTAEDISHKIFQSAAGNNNHIRCLRCLDLTDIQRIVMQAGDLLCDQTSDADTCTFAEGRGKLVHRGGGGGNLSVLG